MSVDELIESVRQLRRQDEEGFRRLVDEISREASLGLSKDVITLARILGHSDAELLDAVDSYGLVRTFGFLRRATKRCAADTISTRVISEGEQSKLVSDMAREAVALAKALEYPESELAEAVDSEGLTDTLAFLRRQAAAKSISLRVM